MWLCMCSVRQSFLISASIGRFKSSGIVSEYLQSSCLWFFVEEQMIVGLKYRLIDQLFKNEFKKQFNSVFFISRDLID